MSKRVADKQLTDRNWQDEDEEEEAGEFTKASVDTMKARVIKTAKRRLPNNNDDKPSAFAGFAGFGAPKLNVQPSFNLEKIKDTNGDTKPLFSFTPKPEDTPPIENATVSKSLFGNAATNNPFTATPPKECNDAFLKKLKKLNQSVIKFAQDHVDKNPFVMLSTVFNDYEKHLARIQPSSTQSTKLEKSPTFKINANETSTADSTSTKPDEPKVEVKPFSSPEEPKKSGLKPFSFGSTTDAPKFSFGGGEGGFSFKPTTSAADSTQPGGGFSFKPSTTSPAIASLFGKPTSTTFSGFGSLSKPADSSAKEAEAEAEETPPEPEKVDHVDKEALYHIKCKLFLKSGEGWNEKGVGIANLKECNGKVQLLIRNDTTMGTVILNTLLHDKLPINKSGKNALMIVATNDDSKTETYLCRVNKSKLDEFYDKLEEYKKGAPAAE